MMSMSWLTPSHFIMFGLLILFACAHSGLAALRPWGENKIGPRLYRVLFALVSLPLATILIIYFINHRYDGLQIWQIQGEPIVRPIVWTLSAISFIFLYPSTFNLLEVAAVQKPQLHLHTTGIIRITRHPQMIGQVIWCIAHTLWIGTTFTLVTSLGLVLHHLFGVWHGDRRLKARYGDAFDKLKEQTSVIPFLAILQGRQILELPEFVKWAYLGIILFVWGFWSIHDWLIGVTSNLNW